MREMIYINYQLNMPTCQNNIWMASKSMRYVFWGVKFFGSFDSRKPSLWLVFRSLSTSLRLMCGEFAEADGVRAVKKGG